MFKAGYHMKYLIFLILSSCTAAVPVKVTVDRHDGSIEACNTIKAELSHYLQPENYSPFKIQSLRTELHTFCKSDMY
jgi:hypothetical protein